MKWLAAILGGVVGYNLAWFALGAGSHGGEPWPTLLFCGPVYLFAAAFGDNLGYVYSLLALTSLLYAAYAWCLLHFRHWAVPLSIVAIHVPFGLWALSALTAG